MAYQMINPVRRRNVVLLVAGVLVLGAIANKPSLVLFFLSARELFNMAVIVVTTLLLAIAINHCARVILTAPGEPWYARPGAFIFMALMLLLVNAAAVFCMNNAFVAFGSGPLFSQLATQFLFNAMLLLWTTVLEWPSYENV